MGKRVLLVFLLGLQMAAASAAQVTVFGAASLANAFKELAQQFTTQYPEHEVVHSFAASDVLLQQILNGAPADIFASADATAMDRAIQEQVIDAQTRTDFATNEVVLVVPADNPLGIQSLADLVDKKVQRIGYGNPRSVPAGRYTQLGLDERLWDWLQTYGIQGQNVRQVLDYAVRNEVDAAFVFMTDAQQAGAQLTVVEKLPLSPVPAYPMAKVARSQNAEQAAAIKEYMDYVRGPQGQEILARFGFGSAGQ
ncbi:MAG TPA: molybdate ABC transporter substrate-binding protein [Paenalcaligenes sp.]|nr:molybdate ABC transporter substrate-binding protein [Paenalcaligenes sp.]